MTGIRRCRLSAVGLLSEIPKPSDRDIDLAMNGNICRCCTYHRIRAAIHDAAQRLESAGAGTLALDASRRPAHSKNSVS